MQRFVACAFLICCCTVLFAEQAPRPIKMGFSIDKSETNFDELKGLRIAAVQEQSAAATLGLQIEDRIIRVNKQNIDSLETLGTALKTLQYDQEISITVIRKGKEHTCSAKIPAPPSHKTISKRQQELEERLAALDKKPERYSLKELLIILRQVEQDLPAAAKEFKEVYPNGRFHIQINIDIDSDTTQADANKTSVDDNTPKE